MKALLHPSFPMRIPWLLEDLSQMRKESRQEWKILLKDPSYLDHVSDLLQHD